MYSFFTRVLSSPVGQPTNIMQATLLQYFRQLRKYIECRKMYDPELTG